MYAFRLKSRRQHQNRKLQEEYTRASISSQNRRLDFLHEHVPNNEINIVEYPLCAVAPKEK